MAKKQQTVPLMCNLATVSRNYINTVELSFTTTSMDNQIRLEQNEFPVGQ